MLDPAIRALSGAALMFALSLGGLALAAPSELPEVMDLGPFGALTLLIDSERTSTAEGERLRLVARWTMEDGTMLAQPLWEGADENVEVSREEEQILIRTDAGSEHQAGARMTTPYTWSSSAQRFLPGPATVSDPWAEAVQRLGARLDSGDFLGVRAQIVRMDLSAAPKASAQVQRLWLLGTWRTAAALAAEGRAADAAMVAIANLAQPPVTAPPSDLAWAFRFAGADIAPGGMGQWVLGGDDEAIEALSGLVGVLDGGGETAAAMTLGKLVVSFEPDRERMQTQVADALWEAGRTDEAKGHYRAAVQAATGPIPKRVYERAAMHELQAPGARSMEATVTSEDLP